MRVAFCGHQLVHALSSRSQVPRAEVISKFQGNRRDADSVSFDEFMEIVDHCRNANVSDLRKQACLQQVHWRWDTLRIKALASSCGVRVIQYLPAVQATCPVRRPYANRRARCELILDILRPSASESGFDTTLPSSLLVPDRRARAMSSLGSRMGAAACSRRASRRRSSPRSRRSSSSRPAAPGRR